MRIAGLQKLTLLDFPGKTAATVFTPGCNFRCPFCHNADLVTGEAGRGLEVVSRVNDIPKGSRLAVSTNLLASLISVSMRATGQIRRLEGGLEEADRRLVAARPARGAGAAAAA